MRIFPIVISIAAACLLTASATAQFTVNGPGTFVPILGDGGDVAANNDGLALYDTIMPGLIASSVVSVPQTVLQIDSIRIDGFEHSWAGDVQATLVDPVGVEHLLFLRPGFLNPNPFGTSGSFEPGTYTFVESGGLDLPTVSDSIDIPAGTYNQTFSSGGTTWVNGTNGINNTPLSAITGMAGNWELRLYDWGNGDSGTFTGWTLNGNNYMRNPGMPYCFGDGSGASCPCSGFGAPGEGCKNSTGSGATLTGFGDAVTTNDTFQLAVTGGSPNTSGIFFQGGTQSMNLVGDGIICAVSDKRYNVNVIDANGEVLRTGFGVNASPGQTLNYQFWYRDPTNACGGLFNFSSAWTVTWQ